MKATFIAGLGLVLASGFLAWNYAPVQKYREKESQQFTTFAPSAPSVRPAAATAKDNTRIQVALLLDTSNSMDGLIDQAKSRLWNIINTLTTLKYQGKTPVIEIALYEYGNDGLSPRENFIRQVVPLTTDLDLISEKLFALRTNGGEEFCGAVIKSAVNALEWGHNEADMKLIYIAGNEPFNQGRVNYATAVGEAVDKQIYVNTIFCGNKREGITTKWKEGADRGRGKYFNIDSDRKVDFIETPYDNQIEAYNTKVNDTYIGYGSYGMAKKQNQVLQDANAKSVSKANSVERYVSKSKTVYKNESWDLVDLSKQDPAVLKKISKNQLPKELQDKTEAEIRKIVEEKSKERETIQKEMAVLAKKRQQYIDDVIRRGPKGADDLGTAISQSIVEFAATKGYTAEK